LFLASSALQTDERRLLFNLDVIKLQQQKQCTWLPEPSPAFFRRVSNGPHYQTLCKSRPPNTIKITEETDIQFEDPSYWANVKVVVLLNAWRLGALEVFSQSPQADDLVYSEIDYLPHLKSV